MSGFLGGFSEVLGGVASGAAAGPVYDPDASAFMARFATQPDAARKQLISDRFVAGKAKSFWSKLDALWVHAAHGPEAARLNWLGDFYNCVPINNPAFTVDRGYMGDGSSSYLDTNFNPATAVNPKYTQDSATLGIRSNTENSAAGSLAGFFDGSKGTTINPRAADGTTFSVRANMASPANLVTPSTSVGMFVVSRTTSLIVRGYRNGTQQGGGSVASTAVANGSLRLGSITNASFRACQFSMGFISAGLADQEVVDLFNWFEPYRSAVGVT